MLLKRLRSLIGRGDDGPTVAATPDEDAREDPHTPPTIADCNYDQPADAPDVCPNCGHDYALLVPPEESSPVGADWTCHLGTRRDDLPGWRVVHTESDSA